MKAVLRALLRLLFGLRVFNEDLVRAKGPVLLLPNHVSWWDWLLVAVCLDDDWRFVTSSTTAERNWVFRTVMVNRRTFPVDIASPYGFKHVAEYLLKGGRLVLFPEGRISTTGSLMKLFDGTGFLILKTRPKVILAHIRGGERLCFSPNRERKRWFPRVSIHFREAAPPAKTGRESAAVGRTRLTNWLRREMNRHRVDVETAFGPGTIPEAIVETARASPGHVAIEDASMTRLTYRKLLAGAMLLAEHWEQLPAESHRRIGVLLPNVNATPLVLFSLWSGGRVPAVLNFSGGPATMVACARLAGLRHIITSRVFLERLHLDLEPFRSAGLEFIFLEDVRARISRTQRLAAFLSQTVNARSAIRRATSADSPALVLFTSGSEGEPKSVELTHANVMANIRQMLSVVDILDTDRFFNALPLFHSFGLTVGTLLPLVRGAYVFLYPSPLHYRVVPTALYQQDCTIFFGTNTFLAGYARKAHPYDFRTVRYLFAGAEKLQESTATTWAQRFGVRVIEGYGATECSPCVTANTPMHPRPGSVGEFLPGIEYRLEKVEGVEAHVGPGKRGIPRPGAVGRLHVRGPNIMRGYLNPEANAKFQALAGWYDTGDVVEVDTEGFVHIRGRLKRFAKISGEMVSLAAVEDALAEAFSQFGHNFGIAVIAQADGVKGEKLVAVTNEPKLDLEQVRHAIRERGLGNLAAPRDVRHVPELPRLGSGKVNYRELEKILGGSGS